MRKDINKVILEGNIGNDPVYRVPPEGKRPLATASLYTNYGSKKADGTWDNRKERHNLVMFGDHANIARDKLRKGTRISVEGRLQTRKYPDSVTQLDKFITEIVVNKLTIVPMMVSEPGEATPAAANG